LKLKGSKFLDSNPISIGSTLSPPTYPLANSLRLVVTLAAGAGAKAVTLLATRADAIKRDFTMVIYCGLNEKIIGQNESSRECNNYSFPGNIIRRGTTFQLCVVTHLIMELAIYFRSARICVQLRLALSLKPLPIGIVLMIFSKSYLFSAANDGE